MKKFISLLLCVLMLFSLAACASDANTPAADAPAADSTEPSPNQNDAPASDSDDTVEITMLSWRSEDSEILNKIGEMFTAEHPNIKVHFDIPTSDETEYYNVMKTRLMSSESKVDILGVHPGSMTNELVEAGKLVELTDSDLVKLITPDLLASEKTADGKIYGVPQTFQAYVIFYNKAIFSECGLEAPTTWDGLMNVASTLRENGYQTIAAGFSEAWTLDLINNPLFTSYNKDNLKIQLQLEQGEANWTDENVRRVFEDVKAYGENGVFIDGVRGTSYDASIALFAQGGAAMLCTGSWDISSVKGQNPDIDFGFFILPNSEDYCPITTALGQSYAINADSANTDAAMMFLEYLYSPEIASLYAEATSQFSATAGVSVENDDLNAVTELLATHDSFPGPNEYPTKTEFHDIVREALARALSGDDVDAILTDAAAQTAALREG